MKKMLILASLLMVACTQVELEQDVEVPVDSTQVACTLSLVKEEIVFDEPYEDSANAYFYASGNWTAEVTEGSRWLSITPSSGEGSEAKQKVKIKVKENESEKKREGEIVFTMEGTVDQVLVVVQSGAEESSGEDESGDTGDDGNSGDGNEDSGVDDGNIPPAELTAGHILLFGDYGQKVWKYSAVTDNVWGIGGHDGVGEGYYAPGSDFCGWWWGYSPDALAEQTNYTDGQVYGDQAAGAYMVFTEDGNVDTYSPIGEKVRGGTYRVDNYDPARASGWELGKLTTSEPAILFPWSICDGYNGPVTEFDIMHLTAQDMTLVFTNGVTPGDWDGITYWCFSSATPDPSTMEGTWTYAANSSYGNAGNTGFGAAFNAPGEVEGRWWGVGSADELTDHLVYAGGSATGDESAAAYMVFEGNTVTTYAPDGTKIRGGEWEAVMNDYALGAGRGDAGWELGKLTTTEPALLFPWMTFGNGTPVTEYDIMYFDAYNMTLVYSGETSPGSWGEITYWTFKRMVE